MDFSRIYPGRSAEEIDQIQRQTFGLRFAYEPYTGFKLAPVNLPMVEITQAGYRTGGIPAPWPPAPGVVNVFVFGGSTTFGYGVAGPDTLSAALQSELERAFPHSQFQCYNFGCGYFFSTQERLRFEQLLTGNHVPKVAIFLDGLNDFFFDLGLPGYSEKVSRVFGSGAEYWTVRGRPAGADPQGLVNGILSRYRANARLIEAIARQWNVTPLLIGQPTPFLDFAPTPAIYPYGTGFAGHKLAVTHYGRFKSAGVNGEFGASFVWCGDAFADVRTIMYADSIHYSPEGNRTLARLIVERARERGLLKF